MAAIPEPKIYQFLDQVKYRKYEDDMLICDYELGDFLEAIKFINDVAEICEKQQHHPEIDIRYDTVIIRTTTHDEGSIVTEKDIKLVEAIEALLDD